MSDSRDRVETLMISDTFMIQTTIEICIYIYIYIHKNMNYCQYQRIVWHISIWPYSGKEYRSDGSSFISLVLLQTIHMHLKSSFPPQIFQSINVVSSDDLRLSSLRSAWYSCKSCTPGPKRRRRQTQVEREWERENQPVVLRYGIDNKSLWSYRTLDRIRGDDLSWLGIWSTTWTRTKWSQFL